LIGEEAEFLTLREMRHSGGGRHHILRIENRHCTPAFRDVNPGDLEIRIIDTIKDQSAGNETVGRNPRLDDKYAARVQMAGHAPHGFPKAYERLRIPNRTEQARDHVKPVTKAEVDERAGMERNPRASLSGNGQHVVAPIEAFHPKLIAQMRQMEAGAASHV
jgi:hypothetical protein